MRTEKGADPILQGTHEMSGTANSLQGSRLIFYPHPSRKPHAWRVAAGPSFPPLRGKGQKPTLRSRLHSSAHLHLTPLHRVGGFGGGGWG